MKRVTIQISDEVARAVEERRRAVPYDRPTPPAAVVIRELIGLGLAATSPRDFSARSFPKVVA